MTFISLGVLALGGGGILFYYNLEKEKRSERVASKVTTTGKAALGGPWSWWIRTAFLARCLLSGQYTLLY